MLNLILLSKYKSPIKPLVKTVYDPSIISDDKILEWGQQAVAQGIENAIANGKREFTEKVNGVSFRVYIDEKTKQVTNFFPVFR